MSKVTITGQADIRDEAWLTGRIESISDGLEAVADVARNWTELRNLSRLHPGVSAADYIIEKVGHPLGRQIVVPLLEGSNLSFAEMELRTIKLRVHRAQRLREERGDRFGHPPYGFLHEKVDGIVTRVPDPAHPIEPLIDAYQNAGSVNGACRVLNAAGIPAPKGGDWRPNTLIRVLEGAAPELLPRKMASGRRQHVAPALLAQLVACPFCETMLTANRVRGQLYCLHGSVRRETHPRYTVNVDAILPWLKEEASHLRTPERVMTAEENAEARAASQARLDRANQLYIEGSIDRAQYDAEKARHADAIEAIDAKAEAVDWPALDWSWPEAELGAVLRAIFIRVELNKDMTPARAIWRLPEYRAD